jgi:hypothetical protein
VGSGTPRLRDNEKLQRNAPETKYAKGVIFIMGKFLCEFWAVEFCYIID